MSAREQVLGRVRTALRRGELGAAARAQLDARLAKPPAHTRIAFTQDPVERFVARAQEEAASVTRVANLAAVGEAVAAFLTSHNLPAAVAAAPALSELSWPEQLTVEFGATRGQHESAVTPCFAAIAETGSLVLLSGEATPTSLSLLPDNHIVVLPSARIVQNFEHVWELLRDAGVDMPRALNLITGPSRTADIEQTIQLGAHGPRRVHIILVEQ